MVRVDDQSKPKKKVQNGKKGWGMKRKYGLFIGPFFVFHYLVGFDDKSQPPFFLKIQRAYRDYSLLICLLNNEFFGC